MSAKERENNFKNIKKVFGIIVPIALFLIVFISSFFSFFSLSNDDYDFSSEYKNYYEVEIDISWGSSNKNVSYVSNYFVERLDNLGYYDSLVDIVDSDTVVVSFPLNNFIPGDEDQFSFSNESDFIIEAFSVITSLMIKTNIEFRTADGQQLFIYDNDGVVEFQKPEAPELPTGSSYNSKNLFDSSSLYEVQLIEKATVEYQNGSPYIEITPKSKFENQFVDAANYFASEEAIVGGYNKIIVWTGYQILYDLVEEYDSDGFIAAESDLYKYIFMDSNGQQSSTPKQFASPFYLTTSDIVSYTTNPFKETYSIYGNFTDEEAKFYADKINFSNEDFSFDVNYLGMKFNGESYRSFKWVVILFISIIVIVSFFFVYWFGLLGLISGVANLLIILLSLFAVNLFGVPLSLFVAFATFFGVMLNLIILWKLFTWVKEDIKDTKNNRSSFDRFKKMNISTILSVVIIFVPIISILMFLSLFSIPLVKFFSSIILITNFLSIITLFLIVIPVLFLVDYLIEFNSVILNVLDKKWSIYFGVKNAPQLIEKEKYKEKVNFPKSENVFKGIVLFSLGVLVISLGIFFTGKIVYGSGFNRADSFNSYYRYTVVRDIEYTFLESSNNADKNDLHYQELMISETKKNKNDIINIFEDNGAKVKDYEIIRYDNFSQISDLTPAREVSIFEKVEWSFTFGINIYTSNDLSSDEIMELENDLEANTFLTSAKPIEEDQSLSSEVEGSWEFNYELMDNFSVTSNSDDKITSYTFESIFDNFIVQILFVILIILLITTIISGIAIGVSITLSILLEVLIVIGMLIIFVVPISQVLLIGIFTFISISLVSKMIYAKREKKGKEKIIEFDILSNVTTFILLGAFALFGLIYISVFGISGILMFIIPIISLILLPITNNAFFKTLVGNLDGILKERKKNSIEKDEWISKQDDVISEEFMDGINK